MELEHFEPLFGEPKVECSDGGSVTHPFLFQVHAPDSCQLSFHVTDFFSSTFEALRSIQQLDDMRDDIGIGGSWSEFVEYLVSSIKLGDVKLVLEGQSKSNGGRLIAQKSKGMPRISVSLHRLVGAAANQAMATLSLDMYKTYNTLLLEEKEGRNQLTKLLSAEKEKSQHLEKQLDGLVYSNKSQKMSDKDSSSANDISADQNPSPMKVSKRVVPAHRRSKVRGVLLQDTEDH